MSSVLILVLNWKSGQCRIQLMRNLPAKIFLCLISFFFLNNQIFAQEKALDFNNAYNNYLYTYDQYRQAHDKYIMTKQSYLNYKTLTSKTEAFNETLKMLQNRDEVVKTYLTALRLKLAQETGITNYGQNVLYLKLDSEINAYSTHRTELTSAGTLEDLTSISSTIQKRYRETEVLLYQTLGAIISGKEILLKDRINQQIREIKEKISQIRPTGNKDTTKAERWSLEAENRLLRSQEKIQSGQQLLAKMKAADQDKLNVYNQATFAFSESHQYLKEANSNLKELIAELKNAD